MLPVALLVGLFPPANPLSGFEHWCADPVNAGIVVPDLLPPFPPELPSPDDVAAMRSENLDRNIRILKAEVADLRQSKAPPADIDQLEQFIRRLEERKKNQKRREE